MRNSHRKLELRDLPVKDEITARGKSFRRNFRFCAKTQGDEVNRAAARTDRMPRNLLRGQGLGEFVSLNIADRVAVRIYTVLSVVVSLARFERRRRDT